MEPDVETVPQIDVAVLDRQPMRFGDGEAGLHHVPTKAVANLGRQVARWENGGSRLDRIFFVDVIGLHVFFFIAQLGEKTFIFVVLPSMGMSVLQYIQHDAATVRGILQRAVSDRIDASTVQRVANIDLLEAPIGQAHKGAPVRRFAIHTD